MEYISVVLLAGGKGSRIPSAVPKQFLPFQGKKMVLHSFDLFASLRKIHEIIVVVEEEYRFLFPPLRGKRVAFADPGLRRQDSVWHGVAETSSLSTFICIHDSARPFVSRESIEKVLEVGVLEGAATLGAPVKNTIKQVDENLCVRQTFPRDTLWQMHTPQVVRKDLLLEGFALAQKRKLTVTDDVSLIELLGYPVKVVRDSYTNIKITTPEDLLIPASP